MQKILCARRARPRTWLVLTIVVATSWFAGSASAQAPTRTSLARERDDSLVISGAILAVIGYLEPIVQLAATSHRRDAVALSFIPFAGPSIAVTTRYGSEEVRFDQLGLTLPFAALCVVGLDLVVIGIVNPPLDAFVLVPHVTAEHVGLTMRGTF